LTLGVLLKQKFATDFQIKSENSMKAPLRSLHVPGKHYTTELHNQSTDF
jgi:hypothetical protein